MISVVPPTVASLVGDVVAVASITGVVAAGVLGPVGGAGEASGSSAALIVPGPDTNGDCN